MPKQAGSHRIRAQILKKLFHKIDSLFFIPLFQEFPDLASVDLLWIHIAEIELFFSAVHSPLQFPAVQYTTFLYQISVRKRMAGALKGSGQLSQPVHRNTNPSKIPNMRIFFQQFFHPVQIPFLDLFQLLFGLRPEKKGFPFQIPVKNNQMFLIIQLFQFLLDLNQAVGISVISMSFGLAFEQDDIIPHGRKVDAQPVRNFQKLRYGFRPCHQILE